MSAEAARTQASEQAKIDKSERVLNVANQHHEKTKKAKCEGRRGNTVFSCNNEGDIERREEHRKENKLAAARSRARKRESTARLEERYRKLSTMKTVMKKHAQELRVSLLLCAHVR